MNFYKKRTVLGKGYTKKDMALIGKTTRKSLVFLAGGGACGAGSYCTSLGDDGFGMGILEINGEIEEENPNFEG